MSARVTLCRRLAVSAALKKIDSESVLFFLGILMAVGALESAGLLKVTATSYIIHHTGTA